MSEIVLHPFQVIVANGRTVTIQIPCYWDYELKEWMLTEDAIKMIDQAKIDSGMTPTRTGRRVNETYCKHERRVNE